MKNTQEFSIQLFRDVPPLFVEKYFPDDIKKKINEHYQEIVKIVDTYKKEKYITPIERLKEFDKNRLIFFLTSIKKNFRFFQKKVANTIVVCEDYSELYDFYNELYFYSEKKIKKVTKNRYKIDDISSPLPYIEDFVYALILKKDKNYKYVDDGLKIEF